LAGGEEDQMKNGDDLLNKDIDSLGLIDKEDRGMILQSYVWV